MTWNVVAGSHTVTECSAGFAACPPSGGFDSGILVDGDTFSHTYDVPGTYPYRCELHTSEMLGTIVVAAATPSPSPTPTPLAATTEASTTSPTAVALPKTGGAPSDAGDAWQYALLGVAALAASGAAFAVARRRDDQMTAGQPVLFYDGDCRFCRATARAVAALDRHHSLAMLPFDDPAAESLLASVLPQSTGERQHPRRPAGRLGAERRRRADRVDAGVAGRRAAGLGGLAETMGCAASSVADTSSPYSWATLSRVTPDGPSPIRRPLALT